MQVKELRQLTDRDLHTRLDEAHRELFNLRQDWYLGRLEDNNRITVVRRDLARLKTVLRERELTKVMEGGAQ